MAIVDSLTELKTWLEECGLAGANIWTDSESSIEAIYSPVITQPLALEAHNLILDLQRKGHPISIMWIPGHKDHTGNEYADYLAKAGRDLPLDTPHRTLYTPPGLVKAKIRELYRGRWSTEWQSYHTIYRHTRLMLPKPNFTELVPTGPPPVTTSKEELKLLLEVVTGHSLLKKHLGKWLNALPQTCTLCSRAKETYHHLVFQCEALAYTRQQHPCDPGEDPITYFKKLLHFANLPRVKQLRLADIT